MQITVKTTERMSVIPPVRQSFLKFGHHQVYLTASCRQFWASILLDFGLLFFNISWKKLLFKTPLFEGTKFTHNNNIGSSIFNLLINDAAIFIIILIPCDPELSHFIRTNILNISIEFVMLISISVRGFSLMNSTFLKIAESQGTFSLNF